MQYEEEEPFSCYYCMHSRKMKDVLGDEEQEPDCMNRLKFAARQELRRVCSGTEKYCMVSG